jgi:hypothetical protein
MNSQTLRNARRITFRVKPDMIDRFLSAVDDRFHPDLRSQPAVRRIYLLRSPEIQNEFLSLTLWNPPESSGGQPLLAPDFEFLSDFLEAPPAVVEFDVVHHEVNEDLPPPEKAVQKVRRSLQSKTTTRRKSACKKSTKRKGVKKGKGR